MGAGVEGGGSCCPSAPGRWAGLIGAALGQLRGLTESPPPKVPYQQDAPLPGSLPRALLQPLLGGLSERFESF